MEFFFREIKGVFGVWRRWRKVGGRGNGSSDKYNSFSIFGFWVGVY